MVNEYTNDQLKIIINCLPIKVKAVLEDKSSKYQEIMAVTGIPAIKGMYSNPGQIENPGIITSNITESNTISTLKTLQDAYDKSGGKMSIQDLKTRAGYYLGEKASRYITVDDHGQVILQFNGSFLTYQELEDMIKKATDEDKKRKEGFWYNLFNKPVDSGVGQNPDKWVSGW